MRLKDEERCVECFGTFKKARPPAATCLRCRPNGREPFGLNWKNTYYRNNIRTGWALTSSRYDQAKKEVR